MHHCPAAGESSVGPYPTGRNWHFASFQIKLMKKKKKNEMASNGVQRCDFSVLENRETSEQIYLLLASKVTSYYISAE